LQQSPYALVQYQLRHLLAIPSEEVQPAPQEFLATKSWRAFNMARHPEVLEVRKIANGQ
jgi:hypothetical protein